MPHSQYFLFEFSGRAFGVAWSRRPICPIDPIEAKSFRPLHPALNGVESDAKSPCDTALRLAAPNGGNDATTLLGGQVFDAWSAPNAFPSGIAVDGMCCKTTTGGDAKERGRNSSRATPSFRSAPSLSSHFLYKVTNRL